MVCNKLIALAGMHVYVLLQHSLFLFSSNVKFDDCNGDFSQLF